MWWRMRNKKKIEVFERIVRVLVFVIAKVIGETFKDKLTRILAIALFSITGQGQEPAKVPDVDRPPQAIVKNQ